MTSLNRLFARWRTVCIDAASQALPLCVLAPVMVEKSALNIVLIVVLLVICLGIHEAAHAWVAWKCGDSTAKDLGRITLNPLAHIDPFMTVIMPAMLFYTTGHAFGGAKPVPVNFHRLRHPWRDMSYVALAGPASNFLLAILFLIAWKVFVITGFYNGAAASEYMRRSDLLPVVLMDAVGFNIVLTVFNLMPIPPLDGSRVMAWVLPSSLRPHYVMLDRFGLFLVFGLLYLVPGFRSFLYSVEQDIAELLIGMVTLGGRW